MAEKTGKKAVRARELEKNIRYHQNRYYNGEPEITDDEFDALWDELRSLDPDNQVFTEINSESTDGFPKEYHLIPMGSQEKAADPESFTAWAVKMPFAHFIVQYKLDGASLELQYENGVLTHAVTRGDGRVGDDITRNARKMNGVLPELPGAYGPGGATPFSGGVRGEVIMTRAVHRERFPDKANCRNAANGLMKRKDGTGCEYLEVLCYDAAPGMPGSPFTGHAPFSDEIEKLDWLASCGFSVVHTEHCEGVQAVIDYRAKVMDIRPELPFDIDGLVIKGREIDPDDLSRPRPEKQIAFKFSLEEAVTVLREVFWSESGATYTPIARIDPVRLAGTTVQRANLVNPNMIAELGLRIGSRIVVTKRGEIIPKIEALVENPPDTTAIVQPDTCSVCGTALADEGTRLYCPNPDCPKRLHHRLEKWIDVLDIRSFGENLIRRLFESGRVRRIPDLYTLTVDELAAMERMGNQSAERVLRSLTAKKSVSLAEFVAGFDIEGIGVTMMDKLVDAGYDTLDKLFAASGDDLQAVYQFGSTLAQTLVSQLAVLRPEMEDLVDSGALEIKPPVRNGIFAGKSFCFTGELAGMKRNEAERLVKSLGGSAKSSVTRDLSFLVTNEPASSSSKSRKARELGIPIIDEPAFLALARGETIAVEPPEPAETSPAKSPQKDPGNQMELGL